MSKYLLIIVLTAVSIFSVSCSQSNANADANNANQAPAKPEYTDAATAFEAGNAFFEANETEKAIDAFKAAVKLDPDLAEAHFKLGIAYAQIESEQELVVTPSEAVNSDEKPKKEAKSNSVLAFENAVTAYKKILGDDPKNELAQFNLGRVYDRLNKDEESRKALEQAVKIKPEDSQYRTELGSILIKLAQYDEAVRSLRKALELDETNARAQDLLEQAEAGKKRVDFGAESIKKTMKPASNSSDSNKSDDKEGANDADSKNSDKKASDKKEPEKKKEPAKAPPVQPKKPGNRE